MGHNIPHSRQFQNSEWYLRVAEFIQERIFVCYRRRGECSVLLTGGRTAERLYEVWSTLPSFQSMTRVRFFFGDERCVEPNHVDSNYGMVIRTLFGGGVPKGCSLFRMEASDPKRIVAAQRYSDLLPEQIDVALFGVGLDGHIASLFPGCDALGERHQKVVPVYNSPKPPSERLTVTPAVILNAREVYILAKEYEKYEIASEVFPSTESYILLPVLLAQHAVWLLDDLR